MTSRHILLIAAAATVTAALLGVLLLLVPGTRVICAAAFCLLAPGYGWARRLPLGDKGDRLAMALVLSICATVAVATAMVIADLWSTVGGLVALGVITAAGFVPVDSVRALAARTGGVFHLRGRPVPNPPEPGGRGVRSWGP
ncbi:MAG: hypothetical protein ACRDMV_16940 [Streptosporangiales bacterium]